MKALAISVPVKSQHDISIASQLAYPITLSLNLAFVYGLYLIGLDIGAVFFIGFFVALISMALLERLLPYRKDWQADKRDWLANGIYFLINGAVDNFAKIVISSLAIYLAPATTIENPILFAGSAALALITNGFFGYW